MKSNLPRLLFEVEPENQKYVEVECESRGISFKTFFEDLLILYKLKGKDDEYEKQLNSKQQEKDHYKEETIECQKETSESNKGKKRGRPKKSKAKDCSNND